MHAAKIRYHAHTPTRTGTCTCRGICRHVHIHTDKGTRADVETLTFTHTHSLSHTHTHRDHSLEHLGHVVVRDGGIRIGARLAASRVHIIGAVSISVAGGVDISRPHVHVTITISGAAFPASPSRCAIVAMRHAVFPPRVFIARARGGRCRSPLHTRRHVCHAHIHTCSLTQQHPQTTTTQQSVNVGAHTKIRTHVDQHQPQQCVCKSSEDDYTAKRAGAATLALQPTQDTIDTAGERILCYRRPGVPRGGGGVLARWKQRRRHGRGRRGLRLLIFRLQLM